MPRKNRGYKRGEPFRDATLFVIACEGAVREREYFELLGERSSRIRIKVLDQEGEHRSAPKWVLDCASKYASEVGLVDDDQLWLVIDVDRWPENQLREIKQACDDNEGWHIALSNPCFEVWLYMHVDDIKASPSLNCSELKTELGKKIKGGYNKKDFLGKIREAYDRARGSDDLPDHFLPSFMRTKLHLLIGEVLKLVGPNSDF